MQNRFRLKFLVSAMVLAAGTSVNAVPTVSVSDVLVPLVKPQHVDILRKGDVVTGPLAASQQIAVVVSLNLRNQNQLDSFRANAQRPGAPVSTRSMTAAQFVAQYSATEAQAQAVSNYLTRAGFKNVVIAPYRQWVSADATADAVRAAFHTSFEAVRTADGRNAFHNTSDMLIPSVLKDSIRSVVGLDTVHLGRNVMQSSNGRALGASLVALTAPALVASTPSAVAAPASTCKAGPWRLNKTDTFTLPAGYLRSQGVTWDGTGWIFSWQGGISRTDDSYTTTAVGTIPAQEALANPPTFDPVTGDNDVAGDHIGDIDVHDGLVYVPVEEGGENARVVRINNPDYQRSYIALFDAKTMQYTNTMYPLPLALQAAGVPWVAVDPTSGDVYTAEWDMLHDRLNVFDSTMHFKRFINLVYPAGSTAGFHLNRVQGAKVLGTTMYATRDDDDKTVFSIDLLTGEVAKLFSLNPTDPETEMEGLAIRPMADGSLLHTLTVYDADLGTSGDQRNLRIEFQHWAPPCN